MELYQLRTFLSVAREGNLTRAAARLYISQPAISAHIKALEEEWGILLFTRTRKGVILTDHGQSLLSYAEQVLASVKQIQMQADALKGEISGSVSLGTVGDAEILRLGSFLHHLTIDFPKIAVRSYNGRSGLVIDQILSGALDAGFVLGEANVAEAQVLKIDEVAISVVAPYAWKDRIKSATWTELAQMPWVWPSAQCSFRQVAESLFAQGDMWPQIAVQADEETAFKELVKAGVGLSLMRSDQAQLALKARELVVWRGAPINIPLSFLFLDARKSDPLMIALLAVMRKTWFFDDGETQAPASVQAGNNNHLP